MGPPSGPSRERERLPQHALVFLYSLVFLALTTLVGLVGGVFVIADEVLLGVALLVCGVVAGAALALLLRRSVLGYWLAVAVLTVVGAAAMAAFGVAGNIVGAVFLCPPLLVGIALARPSIRREILRRPIVGK